MRWATRLPQPGPTAMLLAVASRRVTARVMGRPAKVTPRLMGRLAKVTRPEQVTQPKQVTSMTARRTVTVTVTVTRAALAQKIVGQQAVAPTGDRS